MEARFLEGAPAAGREADGAEPAFVLVEPLRRTTPLVFASPHSGRRYPQDLLDATRLPVLSLRRSEDAYMDEFAAMGAAHGGVAICATTARAYVDLNRDPGELDPDMFAEPPRVRLMSSPRVQAGLGAIPKVAGDGEEIYRRRLPAGEAERRIQLFWRPYHTMLQALLSEARAEFGAAFLIDCHSMPSCARGPSAPDIVLGDRYGAACHPRLTGLVESVLRGLGYRVARNAPFAGGHTTQAYGRPLQGVHALQIELNRGLYLQERSMTRSAGFTRLQADFALLAKALADARLHEQLPAAA